MNFVHYPSNAFVFITFNIFIIRQIIIILLYFYMPGRNAVVIGRSNLVGKPMAQLLLDRNCTVTLCHSRTKNLKEVTSSADIVVVAIGKAKFLKADMVKDGAVVIDVGMHSYPREEYRKNPTAS